MRSHRWTNSIRKKGNKKGKKEKATHSLKDVKLTITLCIYIVTEYIVTECIYIVTEASEDQFDLTYQPLLSNNSMFPWVHQVPVYPGGWHKKKVSNTVLSLSFSAQLGLGSSLVWFHSCAKLAAECGPSQIKAPAAAVLLPETFLLWNLILLDSEIGIQVGANSRSQVGMWRICLGGSVAVVKQSTHI